MKEIQFYKYGENTPLFKETLDHIPCVGDFLIANDKITHNWNKQMFMIMSVTHLLDSSVAIHIDPYDPVEKQKERDQIRKKVENLQDGITKTQETLDAFNKD